MSILVSKLVSVFTADTSDLKKGYDETKRGAKEVTRELKNTEHQANLTADSFMKMAKKAAGFLATAVAAGKSAQQIISEAASMVALDNFAYSIDQNIESVDAFSKAIVSLGGTTSEAESTLSNLYSKVKEASNDAASSAAEDFRKMGISVTSANGQTKDLINVLYDLSGAVEGMDASKAREYIEAIGITDRNVVEAMLQGRRELEAMIRTQKELGVVSKESAEKARAFDAAVGRLSIELKRAKEAIADAILPIFTWFVEKGESAVRFINRNKEVFKGFFFGIAAVVTAVMIPTMWRLAASVLAATWPFLLIATIIGLVGAAIWMLKEDFEAYKKGNKSMIGEVVKDFKDMADRLSDTFERIKDDFVQSFKDMWNAIQPYVYKIEQALNAITMGEYQPKFGPETQFEQGITFAGMPSEVPNPFGDTGPAEYWVYEDGEMVGKITPAQYESGDYLHLLSKKNRDKIQTERAAEQITATIDESTQHNYEYSIENNEESSITKILGDESNSIYDYSIDSNDESNITKIEGDTAYEAITNHYSVNNIKDGIDIESAMNKAFDMLSNIATNPLNKVTSQQLGQINSSNEINIGDITIHTQATDVKGIAEDFNKYLKDELEKLSAESQLGLAR